MNAKLLFYGLAGAGVFYIGNYMLKQKTQNPTYSGTPGYLAKRKAKSERDVGK